jgi:putative hydrolase of HD superfamily
MEIKTTYSDKEIESLVRFLYEVGSLKNVDRSGWRTVCAPRESVAEHSYRSAVLAYVLAKMANMNIEDEGILIKATLFHDLHETRTGDIHKIAKKYVDAHEKECEKIQISKLPKHIKQDINNCLNLEQKQWIFDYLKDADKLECAFRAKEYLDLGFRTQTWIDNTKKILRTKEAKKLFEIMNKIDSLEWIFEEKR